MEYIIQKTTKQPDYELLDSGNEEKLERYGEVILSRPDPQALWNKNLSASEWHSAAGVFSGNENVAVGLPQSGNAGLVCGGGLPAVWLACLVGIKRKSPSGKGCFFRVICPTAIDYSMSRVLSQCTRLLFLL